MRWRRCSSRSIPSLLAVWIGQPLAFLEAQKVVWERRLSPAGPLGGVVAAVQERELLDLGVAVALIALGIVAWRRIGAAYGLYTLVERRDAAHVRLRQGAALVDAAVRGRRLPGVHGARDAGAKPAGACVVTATILAAWLCVYVVRWALWYWVA